MGSDKSFRDLHRLLSSRQRGEIVSRAEVLDATGWKPRTLQTYVRKNKLIDFLDEQDDGNFRAHRAGSGVTFSDIHGALQQKTQTPLTLTAGLHLNGKAHTYTLVAKLGEGATSHVWSARPDGSDALVAVKIVNPRPDLLDPSIFKNLSARFEREAKNGARLSHDCLIRIEDHCKYRGKPFLVMECAGDSAKELLKVHGKLAPAEIEEIIGRCVDGLLYLHAADCIHRDIKPGNILTTERGYVLADMGIVRWSDLNPAFLEAGTITTASMNLGSVNYMAPEQTDDAHQVGPEADVYALGVSWYELLSGNRPNPQALAAGRAPPPTSDQELNDLIGAMTRYDPSSRPSLNQVADFLAKRRETCNPTKR